jgi:hypothetical protein
MFAGDVESSRYCQCSKVENLDMSEANWVQCIQNETEKSLRKCLLVEYFVRTSYIQRVKGCGSEDGRKTHELDFAQSGTIASQMQSGWQNSRWRTRDIARSFNWPNGSASHADSNFLERNWFGMWTFFSRVAIYDVIGVWRWIGSSNATVSFIRRELGCNKALIVRISIIMQRSPKGYHSVRKPEAFGKKQTSFNGVFRLANWLNMYREMLISFLCFVFLFCFSIFLLGSIGSFTLRKLWHIFRPVYFHTKTRLKQIGSLGDKVRTYFP